MKPSDEPIYVTQPHLPPLADFLLLLEEIWAGKVLTNLPIYPHLALADVDRIVSIVRDA